MKYKVFFESFTERHYIRSFAKKYKGAWNLTFSLIAQEFEQIEILFLKNIAETIIDTGDIKICKTEFIIAGTQDSRHGSGNRCIVAIHRDVYKVCVLLVYTKTDVQTSGNETTWWKKTVKDNYPEYKDLL